MLIRKRLMPAVRRYAAGVDLAERDARLVVLSRRGRRAAPIRVEWLDAVPLRAGTMTGGQVADRPALTSALANLLARWRGRGAARSIACAMAIPGSLTSIASVSIAMRSATRADALAELEPAVLARAEGMAGLEREALAVDWFIDEPARCGVAALKKVGAASNGACVTIAAVARQHLEARIEAAAGAGMALAAVDGEPPAALRALCHAAAGRVRGSERYAALWAGGDGLYGWRIGAGGIETQVRFPALAHEDVPAALRELAGEHVLALTIVGGALDALRANGVTAADIGDWLGCPVLVFECAAFFDAHAGVSLGRAHRCARDPVFAVAFGLALRGVTQ